MAQCHKRGSHHHGQCWPRFKTLRGVTSLQLINIKKTHCNTCMCRWYTTIENPSYFFMPLSCREAMQSIISYFNRLSLINLSWGNISSWVWQGLATDLESYGAKFDTTVIWETEFQENNKIFISYPGKHKRNWKMFSTINVTYAPIQFNSLLSKEYSIQLS